VKAVAKVLDLRTVMLRRLYFSGSAMILVAFELNLIFLFPLPPGEGWVRAYGPSTPN
jgi:hypothetical protein